MLNEVVHAVVHLASAFQFLKLYAVCGKPFAVGVLICKLLLYLSVVVYLALLCVDEENLARLQASLLGYLRRVEVHHADFRRYNHSVVFRNSIPCRAQSVAVEHSSGKPAVAEEQGGRTVPRFHKDGVVFIEGLEVF